MGSQASSGVTGRGHGASVNDELLVGGAAGSRHGGCPIIPTGKLVAIGHIGEGEGRVGVIGPVGAWGGGGAAGRQHSGDVSTTGAPLRHQAQCVVPTPPKSTWRSRPTREVPHGSRRRGGRTRDERYCLGSTTRKWVKVSGSRTVAAQAQEN